MSNLKTLALLGFASLGLAACGSDSAAEDVKEQASSSSSVASESSAVAESTSEIDPMLVTNGPMLEVGQYVNDPAYGRLSLVKIATPEIRAEVASGIFFTIHSVKLINFENIPDSGASDVSTYIGISGKQGYDLQVVYSVENETDSKLGHTPLSKLVLSDGEQITRRTFVDETMSLEPHSKSSNQIAHVAIPNPDITSVSLYLEPTFEAPYVNIEATPIEVAF
jgi:hypothetical protein